METVSERQPNPPGREPTPDPVRAERRLRSKVSRLPADIREFVNQSINDGLTYPAIIAQLEQKGYPGFNPQNLCNWYYSGYQRWLRDQERLESLRLHAESMKQHTQELDPDRCAKTINDTADLLALRWSDTVHRHSPQIFSKLLAKDPKNYFRLAAFLNRQERLRIQRETLEAKMQFDREEHPLPVVMPKEFILTPETIKRVKYAASRV